MPASTKMQDTKHQDDARDDLSDAASSNADERTLNDEPLPSYNQASSTSNIERRPLEKTSIPSPENQNREQAMIAHGPTVEDPFAFPSHELPSCPGANTIQRPLAIPQMTPSAAAPFLPAYPTALLSFGITMKSWYSFVDTLSAFLSANVSQKAIHHASDIASNIGDFHKQYALRTKEHFKNIGKSAKRLSPVGILSQTIGLTVGSAGHVINTVFQAAGSLSLKPQTPRERASVYLQTANRDWFHSRGLHAVLMSTSELCSLCEVETREMMSAVESCGSVDPGQQLAALRDVIAEVNVEESLRFGAVSKESSTRSSKASGKLPVASQLQLGDTTLWLVLVQRQDEAHPTGKTTYQTAN